MKEKLAFDATYRNEGRWDMADWSCQEAAEIVIDLSVKNQLPIFFKDITAVRLGLALRVPVEMDMINLFDKTEDQIRDERDRIKNFVESLSPYRLVLINKYGQSAISGGYRQVAGFDLRDSDAGLQDDKLRIKMSKAAMIKALERQPELRNDPEIRAVILGVRSLVPPEG
jgi:hypothetical protein